MNVETSNNHYFDIPTFSRLFSEKVDSETILSLKKTAIEGDLHSIELLNNLALRQDESGTLAENILFDLFCKQTLSNAGSDVIQEVKDCALRLYQLSGERTTKDNNDMQKLRTPSKLLYIAGSAANADEKTSLSQIFTQGANAFSQYEQVEDNDIWGTARMISTDEINHALRSYFHPNNKKEINYPIGLINPHSHENMLSQQIIEKIEYNTTIEKPEFFPLNTGDHWITFGLYPSSDNTQLHAVICNTADDLSLQTKQHIIDTAQLAGVTDLANIVFLEKNIQDHIPNGCGLLTIEAIKLLIENDFQSPTKVLETFLSSFTQMPAEEREQYNLQNRYRVYAETYLQ